MVTKGYGITVEEIDWSCPADLEPYAKAHEMEIKETDSLMHSMGMYNKIAFEVVMDHFGSGLAGKRSKAKYIEHPFMHETKRENQNAESKEEVAVFEMNQRIKLLKEQGLPESPE